MGCNEQLGSRGGTLGIIIALDALDISRPWLASNADDGKAVSTSQQFMDETMLAFRLYFELYFEGVDLTIDVNLPLLCLLQMSGGHA